MGEAAAGHRHTWLCFGATGSMDTSHMGVWMVSRRKTDSRDARRLMQAAGQDGQCGLPVWPCLPRLNRACPKRVHPLRPRLHFCAHASAFGTKSAVGAKTHIERCWYKNTHRVGIRSGHFQGCQAQNRQHHNSCGNSSIVAYKKGGREGASTAGCREMVMNHRAPRKRGSLWALEESVGGERESKCSRLREMAGRAPRKHGRGVGGERRS
eukprot:351020-Chlamydomonas_euryale.AAC.1